MNEGQNRAVLVALIKSLRSKGSWCGETHIQKAAFFLKTLTGVPIDFDFILYKHGPFSFDLRDELSVMRAYGLLALEANYPYGPRILDTYMGKSLRARYPKTLGKYERQITFIADRLGNKGVVDLERLATAYYVTLDNSDRHVDTRAKEIVKLKPHIEYESAQKAVKDVDVFIEQIREEKLLEA
ncbi:MAG: hypothetical protein IMF18_11260 [Proteobacteria bacterium]|nr:hypothetical protein [Pseudomonadota bacterium]